MSIYAQDNNFLFGFCPANLFELFHPFSFRKSMKYNELFEIGTLRFQYKV